MDIHSEIVKTMNQATDNGASKTADYADAIMPLVRRAQAEALREAAADNGHGWALRTWLAGRANRIEQELEHE